MLASRRPKSRVLSELYGWLNFHLVRSNVRGYFVQTFMPSSGIQLSLYVVL